MLDETEVKLNDSEPILAMSKTEIMRLQKENQMLDRLV
jgi:hypothetical protein